MSLHAGVPCVEARPAFAFGRVLGVAAERKGYSSTIRSSWDTSTGLLHGLLVLRGRVLHMLLRCQGCFLCWALFLACTVALAGCLGGLSPAVHLWLMLG
jgi:hypothetical protein